MNYIYALIDPRNSCVRYIGRTNDMWSRFRSHLDCESGKGKIEWLRELREENYVPIMKKIEEVETVEEAIDREKFWIRFFHQADELTGGVLTNISDCKKLKPIGVAGKPGRKRTNAEFMAQVEEFRRTGVSPWKRTATLYVKKKFNIE